MTDGIHRLAFTVDNPTFERAQRIPHGMRSEILRQLLAVAMDTADKHGEAAYGALVVGQFVLTPREQWK